MFDELSKEVMKADAEVRPTESIVEQSPMTTSPFPQIPDDEDDADGVNAASSSETLTANVGGGQTQVPLIGGYSTWHESRMQSGRREVMAST